MKTVLKDPDKFSEEAPLIILDSKSALFMSKNGKDTKHKRKISRRIHLVSNGENCKRHKIDWCEGGPKLSDSATKNVDENDLTPRIIYIMVRLNN